MSKNVKIKELRQELVSWKTSNEVHALPSDKLLYKVLDGIINLIEYEQEEEIVEPVQAIASDDEGLEGPGGNNPGGPIIP